MISVTIDGRTVDVEEGTTILEAAKMLGIEIPTLCYHEGLPPDGNCRLCQVEIEEKGRKKLVISCMYPIRSSISVCTDNERVRTARSFIISLLLNRSPNSKILNELADKYNVERFDDRFKPESDTDCCIRCGACVRACKTIGNSCLEFAYRGADRIVTTAFEEPPEGCILCGACADVCPTGAINISETDSSRTMWGVTSVLVRCSRCNEKFATQSMVEVLAYEGEGERKETLCPRCRRVDEAKRIANLL